ncbi:hypothetical protein NQ185_05900 [Lederbergia panacisoli]|nr:hypothetical protein [Lederbergia panacisoli]MCR2821177.1 hypothetical protein [Lederbergia panacisoli]
MSNKNNGRNESEVLIGIVGPKELDQLTKEALKSFPNFKASYFNVDSSCISPNIPDDFLKNIDVLLFTEYHLYNMAKQEYEFNIPVHHVPLMGTGLYRSLFLVKNTFNLEHLSVDTVEVKYVEQILIELEEEACELIVYKNNSSILSIKEIVQFHAKNYQERAAIPLTGIQEVSRQLKEMGIPHEWVTPTKLDMIVSLERALLATDARKNKEAQIVFGLINVDNLEGRMDKFTSEHDVQLLKLSTHQMLLDYTKLLDGHLTILGGEEYLFITTRGIFERETRGYKFIPLLQDTKNKLGISLCIGIGFGMTAAEAGTHARLALRQSKEVGGDVCYIVREDRSVLGPVEITSHTQYERYDLAITDAELLDKAQTAGMSATYMTRLMARVARYRKYDYTAQDLASTLKITVRSANRILLKLMDAELVEIIGEEKVTHKGRPRRIYRLNFVMDENAL